MEPRVDAAAAPEPRAAGPVRLAIGAGPPLHHPLRFFCTAPAFGVAAGLLLLEGPAVWSSRWMPAMLAAVHLVTLGVMLMVMAGALYQVVPVLQARSIPGARITVPVVHAAVTAGTLALAGALRWALPGLYLPAAVLLAVAVLVLLGPVGVALARQARGGSVPVLRLALLSLLATVGLGVWLAVGMARPELALPVRAWTDVHAGFGLAGWTLLLVVGVTFQVVPMFHVTPPFPRRWVIVLGATSFLALVAASHARGVLALALATAVVLAASAWAVLALRQLGQRKRRQRDALVGFWWLALGSVLAASALLLASWWVLAPVAAAKVEFLAGALAIAGFALSAIVGMQHKIFAFLLFVHLQRRALPLPWEQRVLPLMDDLVPPPHTRFQLAVHGAMVLAFALAVLWPPAGRVGAGLLIADFVVLAAMQWSAVGRYRRAARAMA